MRSDQGRDGCGGSPVSSQVPSLARTNRAPVTPITQRPDHKRTSTTSRPSADPTDAPTHAHAERESSPRHCACTRPFPSAAAWERHATHTGCTMWKIDLDAILEETPQP